jgi:hypothetical protein
MTDDRLYSASDVAEELDLTVAYVRRVAERLGLGQRVGKSWVFRREDIEAIKDRGDGRSREMRRDQTET